MPLPPDAPVDLNFLDSPTALDVQRRDFLPGAIHYARWACTLNDEVLGALRQAEADGAQPQALRPLIAASEASACAYVAELLAAWHESRLN